MHKNSATLLPSTLKNDAGTSPPAKRISVAVLALPEVLALDFGIPLQILGRIAADLYDVSLCSEGGLPVPAIGGFSVTPQRGLDLLAEVDTIIIPGFTHSREPLPPDVLQALAHAHARGARMVSICTGAFALAQAGILNGLSATTHWESTQDLARLFPLVSVDPNVLFVDNGQVLSSAGVAAGIDLCLHLVRKDWGSARSNRVARETVAAPRREGSQAQFISHPSPRGSSDQDGDLGRVMGWALANMQQQITVDTLSRKASISQRTLCRRFERQLDMSPIVWLTTQRVERAKEHLETSEMGIESIAKAVGLGSASNFRQVFKKATSLTPSQYRNAFTPTIRHSLSA